METILKKSKRNNENDILDYDTSQTRRFWTEDDNIHKQRAKTEYEVQEGIRKLARKRIKFFTVFLVKCCIHSACFPSTKFISYHHIMLLGTGTVPCIAMQTLVVDYRESRDLSATFE